MNPDQLPIQNNELDVLNELVPLQAQAIIELGCGAARLARDLLQRWPLCHVTGLEVDALQHAKNLAAPQDRLVFLAAGAQAVPLPGVSFDLALMLKSLHHVPMAAMDQALDEVARVVRPGGHLYVSEPIYGGALNELVRLYNDEGVVRSAAQAALDRALSQGQHWEAVAEKRFAQALRFASFDDFAQRMMYPSFADHRIDEAMLARVRAAFEPHSGEQGAAFVRPMHVRLLRRKA
ncbi:class I SAM-dependent methyltransferase [Hydrogenophaga sp.]|uniref:class I SAM-dependent methyltransferase n=1 Tax=Hydrogenophaga sp. TaxID=1904254 RepID=UPI0025C447BF|nr:class I SAM-dependent methyltransferase [Hydrogenophaga sp.]